MGGYSIVLRDARDDDSHSTVTWYVGTSCCLFDFITERVSEVSDRV